MSVNGGYRRLTEADNNGTQSEIEPMLNEPMLNDVTPSIPQLSTPPPSFPPSSSPPPSSPPPSYSPCITNEDQTEHASDNELPPAYHVAAKLPTYEEAERTKDTELRDEDCAHRTDESAVKVGTDGLFGLCFIVAFIFNWIGFIFAYCVTNTVAGRYGALSGFGLSLIKWVFIFKHSKCCKDLVFQDAWLWWLLALLGWLIFIRGILVYVQVKKIVKAGQELYVPRYWGLTRSE